MPPTYNLTPLTLFFSQLGVVRNRHNQATGGTRLFGTMNARGRLTELPAPAKHHRHDYDQQAELDVNLLAVEKIDRLILEIRVRKDSVNVEERSGSVGGEKERLPPHWSQPAQEDL